MLVTGWVSSRLGSRLTLILGAALIVVFVGLAGTSNSVLELVNFRAGWGLGNAFFVVTALSVIVAVARGGTGSAVLLYEAAIDLGLSVGPLIGAALGAHSWRWPFFGTATLMAIGLIAILMFLPDQPKPARKVSLTAPVRALAHPGLFTVSLSGFFYYYAFFTVLAFAPFVLNMSAHAVGLIFFGWGLLFAVFSVLVAPRVEARFGLLPVIYTALAILAVLLVVMGVSAPGVVAVCVVISGAVIGLINTYFTELALEVSDVPRPVASAGYNFLRCFAGVIAPFLAPTIAEHVGVTATFAVAAIAALIAPAIILVRRRTIIAEQAAEPGEIRPATTVLAAIDGTSADLPVIARAIEIARPLYAEILAIHVRMSEVFAEGGAEIEAAADAERAVAAALKRIAQAGLTGRGRS